MTKRPRRKRCSGDGSQPSAIRGRVIVDEIIETYDRAWNSSELADRQRLLEAALALTDDCDARASGSVLNVGNLRSRNM
jgi:hypothetical protein